MHTYDILKLKTGLIVKKKEKKLSKIIPSDFVEYNIIIHIQILNVYNKK